VATSRHDGGTGRAPEAVLTLLPALFEDLRDRSERLRERLLALDLEGPAENAASVAAYTLLLEVESDVGAMLGSPKLAMAAHVSKHLRQLRRKHENVRAVESHSFPSLQRLNADDRAMTALAMRLIDEHALPMPAPLVTASSTSYYFTVPQLAIVSVPAAEVTSLLGLADLAHELGHLLVEYRWSTILDGLGQTAEDVLARRRDEGLILDEVNGVYDALLAQWQGPWLIESACDSLGAYVFGPAYVFQHLRLCSSRGLQFWMPGRGRDDLGTAVSGAFKHPANEARFQVLIRTLRELGAEDDALACSLVWNSYRDAVRTSKPPWFDDCYPDELLSPIAAQLCDRWRTLGVRSYRDAAPESVSAAAISGWQAFLDPSVDFRSRQRTLLASILSI
jgi:hypothetical protein